MQQNEFQHIPATFWVYALLPFAVIAITMVGIKTHNPFMFGFIGVVPFCFLLVNRLDLWLVTIFAVFNSSLRIPGLLGNLELVHVLMAGLIGVVVFRSIIVKERIPRRAWMWRLAILWCGILLITIGVRGTGFRFLGDTMWGGMRYVEILLTFGFMFVVAHLRVSVRHWKLAIVAMSVLILVPMIADAVFVVSKGAIYHHYYLIRHGGVEKAFQTFGTDTVTRFKSGAGAGWAMVLLPFILFPATRRNLLKYAPFILAGLVLSAISGFRISIISLLGFLGLYGFYVNPGRRVGYVVLCGVGVVVLMALIIALAPYLPWAVQRAVSFVPFVDIDSEVAFQAAGSTRWRLKLWQEALRYDAAQYLLIGKGYTYDPALLASETYIRSGVDWARVMSAYHNGPISLLIGMGVGGLITGIGFLFAAVIRHLRFNRMEWVDLDLHRFHTVFFVVLVLQVLRYLFLYGDVFQSYPEFFKTIAILEGLSLVNIRLTREQAEAGAEVGVAATEASPRPRMPIRVAPF